jgi:hypothetical protein
VGSAGHSGEKYAQVITIDTKKMRAAQGKLAKMCELIDGYVLFKETYR